MSTTLMPVDTADSRTASFERKRAYHGSPHGSVSNSICASAKSTPQKRARVPHELEQQDVVDVISYSNSFIVPESHVQENGNSGIQVSSGLSQDQSGQKKHEFISSDSAHATASPKPQGLGPVSILNWNVGSNLDVHASLGATPTKAKHGKLLNAPTVSPSKSKVEGLAHQDSPMNDHSEAQTQATEIAHAVCQGLRERLSRLDIEDHIGRKTAEEELHNAEVDYQYCQYYPLSEEFKPPPITKAHESIDPALGVLKQIRIWLAAEECIRNGNLEELRDGKILGIAVQDVNSTMASKQGSSDPKQNQMIETQKAFRRHREYIATQKGVARRSTTNPNLRAFLEKECHEAKVDLNYCQYYPKSKVYQSLAVAKAELEQQPNAVSADSEGTPAQIWKMVEQGMVMKTLKALQDGTLDSQVGDSKQIAAVSSPKMGLPSDVFSGNRGRGRRRKHIHRPKSAPSPDQPSSHRGVQRPCATMLNMQKSPSRSWDPSLRHSSASDEIYEDSSDVESSDYRMDLERTEADIAVADFDTGDYSDSEGDAGDSLEEDETDDAEDEMIIYSNSERQQRSSPTTNPQIIGNASILADLGLQDLNDQIRYFHATKDRKNLYHDLPVRCLVCMQQGHMAAVCEMLTCRTCGAYNKHSSACCPTQAKCEKCREQGHSKSECPYKLKKVSRRETVCDLCQRNGHVEEDCELYWRTSGRPWEADYAGTPIRLFCYECGLQGHLGNECFARRPGKALATSSWSLNRPGQAPSITSGEVSIRGRARKQSTQPMVEDDRANFFGKKVPEPARKTNISINIASDQKNTWPPAIGWTPINKRHPVEEQRPAIHTDYGDSADYGGYPETYNFQGNGYAMNDRRSRSPPYNNYRPNYDDERYQEPVYQQPAPYYAPPQPTRIRGGDMYRPMPSAARNAWNRHLV